MKVGMKPIILTNKNNENLLYVSTEFRHLIKNKPTQTGRAWQLGKKRLQKCTHVCGTN